MQDKISVRFPQIIFLFFFLYQFGLFQKIRDISFYFKYYNSDRGYAILEEKRVWSVLQWLVETFQLIFTCSKSIIETLKKGVKYVQS